MATFFINTLKVKNGTNFIYANWVPIVYRILEKIPNSFSVQRIKISKKQFWNHACLHFINASWTSTFSKNLHLCKDKKLRKVEISKHSKDVRIAYTITDL